MKSKNILLPIFVCVLFIIGMVLVLHDAAPTANAQGQGVSGYGKTYDSGMQTLPSSATALTTNTTLVKVIFCANTTAGAVTLTITDNQGSPVTYVPTQSVAANTSLQVFNSTTGFIMSGGIKWNAGAGSSINCQIAGFQ